MSGSQDFQSQNQIEQVRGWDSRVRKNHSLAGVRGRAPGLSRDHFLCGAHGQETSLPSLSPKTTFEASSIPWNPRRLVTIHLGQGRGGSSWGHQAIPVGPSGSKPGPGPGAVGQELPFGGVLCPQYHLTSSRSLDQGPEEILGQPVRTHAGQAVDPPSPSSVSEVREPDCLPAVLPRSCSKSCIWLWTLEASFWGSAWPRCPAAAPHSHGACKNSHTWRNTRSTTLTFRPPLYFLLLLCEYF